MPKISKHFDRQTFFAQTWDVLHFFWWMVWQEEFSPFWPFFLFHGPFFSLECLSTKNLVSYSQVLRLSFPYPAMRALWSQSSITSGQMCFWFPPPIFRRKVSFLAKDLGLLCVSSVTEPKHFAWREDNHRCDLRSPLSCWEDPHVGALWFTQSFVSCLF